jgi:hypothetical protein
MKNVIGIGFTIPSKEEDFLALDSKGSLSDADVIIFSPNMSETNYRFEFDSFFEGKRMYNENSSFKIREDIHHWHNELNISLKAGKTIFVNLREKNDFVLYTGQKQTSGTGRNQKVTNIVEPSHNYKFLPIPKLKVHNSKGSQIFLTSPILNNLFEFCKQYFTCEAYITLDDVSQQPLFTTKDKDRILGLILKIFNGHIVFIPSIKIPDNFTTQSGNWTKEALTWGDRFKGSLVDIHKQLNYSPEKSIAPEWVSEKAYELMESEKTKILINENHQKITELQNEINQLTEVLKEQELLKDLLFETGKPLELSVIKALEILGYKAENYNDGVLELDQVIISPEGERFIGECEGKDTKHIDITKFRQLVDSLNEDLAREEITERALGILFGNPQRLLPPEEREVDFTEKCKNAAEREKVALVKTPDLFKVVKYISESGDEDYKVACRLALKGQLGRIVEFPPIPE